MFSLKDKVAIITGGNSGIGRGMAEVFARAKAKVCVIGQNEERGKSIEKIIRETGTEGFFVKADVSNKDDIKSVVDETVKRYGGLHIMVNNAARIAQSTIVDMKETEWDVL